MDFFGNAFAFAILIIIYGAFVWIMISGAKKYIEDKHYFKAIYTLVVGGCVFGIPLLVFIYIGFWYALVGFIILGVFLYHQYLYDRDRGMF